jgi:glycine/D-amino acid oxidase-like deaminating enzyme
VEREPIAPPATALIVGGGVAGLASAWHLARAGVRVTLLEREDQLGTHSSGRNAAILRTLAEDPVTTALARAGAAFLVAPPEGFAPYPLAERCGLLLIADPDGAEELDRIARASGAEHLAVDAGHAAGLAPHWGGEVARAYHLPDEGRIDVAALLEGFARGARAAGADLRTGAGVDALLREGARVTGVRLAGGEELHADAVLLAAGGWAGRLGAAAGSSVELTPTRRHLMSTAPEEEVDAGWPVLWNAGEAFYCRPESGGLLLCACDEVEVDPDRCEVDPAVRERIAEAARKLLPGLAGLRELTTWCGMRTHAADRRFLVGPDPDLGGLWWVAALGGHGMVCGPEVGRLAAALVRGEAGAEDPGVLAALDPGRPAVRAGEPPCGGGGTDPVVHLPRPDHPGAPGDKVFLPSERAPGGPMGPGTA